MAFPRRLIGNLLRPPSYASDSPLALQAMVLYRVLLAIGGAMIIIGLLVPFFAYNVPGSLIAVASMLAFIIAAFVLLRRGNVQSAARLTVAFTWLTAVVFVTLSGGLSNAGVTYLVAATTMSGLLLEERGMLSVTIASVVVGAFLLILDEWGFSLPQFFRLSHRTGWVALTLSLVATTTLVNYAIRNLRMTLIQTAQQSELHKLAQTELQQMAITDALTGSYNRRYFFDRVEQLLSLAVQEKSSLALIMIDADHFKNINDTYGHAMGDRVLKHVAEVLSKRVRTTDVLARYGGEEFVLFLKDVTAPAALGLAERMRVQVEESPYRVGEGIIPLTISIGITICDTNQEDPVLDELIARADRALYAAKQNGRNCCVLEQATRR